MLIETTGLADPAPVIQALMTFPVVQRYRLRQVVTTVDAVNGARTLERHPEVGEAGGGRRRPSWSPRRDLAGAAADEIVSRLRRLNPGARLHHSAAGAFPAPAELANVDLYDPATKSADVLRWLNAEAYAGGASAPVEPQHGEHRHGDRHHHDVNRHGADIGCFCLNSPSRCTGSTWPNWLDALVLAHGDDILRVKGILTIVGRERPIVVQAVQHLFHPPVELADWPGGARRSRIVFIVRGLTRDYICEVLDIIRQRRVAADPAPQGA